MSGLDIVKKGGSSKITMPGAPPLDKYLKDAIDAGVEVTACGPSKEMLHVVLKFSYFVTNRIIYLFILFL